MQFPSQFCFGGWIITLLFTSTLKASANEVKITQTNSIFQDLIQNGITNVYVVFLIPLSIRLSWVLNFWSVIAGKYFIALLNWKLSTEMGTAKEYSKDLLFFAGDFRHLKAYFKLPFWDNKWIYTSFITYLCWWTLFLFIPIWFPLVMILFCVRKFCHHFNITVDQLKFFLLQIINYVFDIGSDGYQAWSFYE